MEATEKAYKIISPMWGGPQIKDIIDIIYHNN